MFIAVFYLHWGQTPFRKNPEICRNIDWKFRVIDSLPLDCYPGVAAWSTLIFENNSPPCQQFNMHYKYLYSAADRSVSDPDENFMLRPRMALTTENIKTHLDANFNNGNNMAKCFMVKLIAINARGTSFGYLCGSVGFETRGAFHQAFCQCFSLTTVISYWNPCIWLAESKFVSEKHWQNAWWNAPLRCRDQDQAQKHE